jgi:hypothetical protein
MFTCSVIYVHVQCDLGNALCLSKAPFRNKRLLHSKTDPIYVCDIVFEMHDVIKD